MALKFNKREKIIYAQAMRRERKREIVRAKLPHMKHVYADWLLFKQDFGAFLKDLYYSC